MFNAIPIMFVPHASTTTILLLTVANVSFVQLPSAQSVVQSIFVELVTKAFQSAILELVWLVKSINVLSVSSTTSASLVMQLIPSQLT